jgi:ABC-type oligopeptide transport system ATPase subunit
MRSPFTIDRGKTLGLVGESGSDKSTIGRCVAALQKPTTGLVKILGRNIAGLSQQVATGAGALRVCVSRTRRHH